MDFNNNKDYFFRLHYFNEGQRDWAELVSTFNGYDGTYEEYEMEDKTVYFAESVNLAEGKDEISFSYFGYVQSNASNQIVAFSYYVFCMNEGDICQLNETNERTFAEKIIHSIKFNSK